MLTIQMTISPTFGIYTVSSRTENLLKGPLTKGNREKEAVAFLCSHKEFLYSLFPRKYK